MISANNITLRIGKKALFEDVNIKFTEGNCYGLIGANGAGKSTFLKILSGQLDSTSGDIAITPGQRLSFLQQDHFKYDQFAVLDTVIMGNARLYQEWFDNYFASDGDDFEVMGLSYDPFLHGSLEDLEHNMNDIALRYGKELLVAEASMAYTMEDYASHEELEPSKGIGMAARQKTMKKMDYPVTKQGQADFMKDFIARIRRVPKGLGKGFFYWEPAWIPTPGSGWATEASLKYMKEPGPCGNQWANQALFDYEGRPLPALNVIKKM